MSRKIIHRVVFVLSIFTAAILMSSCTQSQQQGYSHWKSDLIGLNRRINLYAADGKVIKTWQGRYKVEVVNGAARFLEDGKAVIISGTYTIEEL